MTTFRYCFAAALAIAPIALLATPAAAQNATSWVSVTGDNSNACTETEPCRGFTAAHDATDAGGTIRCLNAGNFGGLIINKSITIDCQATGGGTTSSQFFVGTAGIQVVLRGLSFDGRTDAATVVSGLDIVGASTVVVEDCAFRDAKGLVDPGGVNILVRNLSGLVELSIRNTAVSGARVAGIRVKPTSTGSAKVVVGGSSITDNGAGIQADSSSTSGQINLTVVDTVLDGNTNSGLAVIGGTGQVAAFASRVTSVNNGSHGLRVANANAVLRVSDSDITANIIGTEAINGAVLTSFGNNRIIGNNGNNGPLPPVIALQ